MKKTIITTLVLLTSLSTPAQENHSSASVNNGNESKSHSAPDPMRNLKISGYIQTQFQWGEKDASLKVGSANENPGESFNRFGVRRGRVKFTYTKDIASAVFQLDITEKGVGIKDVYLTIKEPWTKIVTVKAGIFDRPFGYEISYSSSRRESPERSAVFQTLFPDERDLGVMLAFQAPESSPLHAVKLEAGLFAGNGIKQETDSRKDFIGHLSFNKSVGSKFSVGLGASYYNGGVYQGTEKVYSMKDEKFIQDHNPANKGKYAKREYIGFDGRLSYAGYIGTTRLGAEFITGKQPGKDKSSKSPNSSNLPESDTYIRSFSGGYVVLVQDIGRLPLSAVVKYDWYDPNTDISSDQIGLNGTGKTDLSQHTLGLGAVWRLNSNIRLQAYYEINKNEKSTNVGGMNTDIDNDVFTLRLQYKF